MAAPPLHKLLMLEESVINSMAGNPNFVREFPFLKNVTTAGRKRTGCGKCNRKASRRVQSVNAAKQQIISLGKEQKSRLKKRESKDQSRRRRACYGVHVLA
jgi:hypothetical protein